MPNPKDITPEVLGYIAGFIDGEGTIGLRRSVETRDGRSLGRSGWYHPIIRVTNTNQDVIYFIQYWLGGGITVIEPKENTQKAYCLSWGSQDGVEAVIKAVINFLIVKRPQAEMLLAWLEKHRQKITDYDWDAFYKSEFNKINARGRQEDAER